MTRAQDRDESIDPWDDDERSDTCQILIAPFTLCDQPVEQDDDTCAHHRVRMLWDLCRRLNAQMAGVRQMAEEWAKLCPEGDWGSGGIENAMIADCGRAILRRLEATS